MSVPLTRLIGRERDVSRVVSVLRERRLVTLTGTGGVGKTRLALAVATASAAEWEDGVVWVDLGVLATAEQVDGAVAAAVGIRVEPGHDATEALARQLRHEHLLLCLDTCEHLLAAVAALVEVLLSTCPSLTVLATSRQRLDIGGEAVWEVPMLPIADALELFADRAALASPNFDLTLQREQVAAACRHLDGLPLAIELAAAWSRMLTPAQIGAGLDSSIRLLAEGPQASPARHRSLSASMAWSHQLLEEQERVVFRRLAVMRGSFTGQSAALVVSDHEGGDPDSVVRVLRRLVDRSLIVARPDAREGIFRYAMLDTVRQFAAERLEAAGETQPVRDRHLGVFVALAEGAEQGLDEDEDRWRQALVGDRENINAALEWGFSDPTSIGHASRLAASMARHWMLTGQAAEGLAWLNRALSAADDTRLEARLHGARALLAMVAGRVDELGDSVRAGIDLSSEIDDQATLSRCLALGAYEQFFHDFERCQALAVEAHARATAGGEPFARDWALILQAYSLTRRDRHTEAVALARSALAQSTQRGDRFCSAFAIGVDVFALLYTGDVSGAVSESERMMHIVNPLGDFFAVGTNATTAALALGMAGQPEAGQALMRPVTRAIEKSDDIDVVGFHVVLGNLALWKGDVEEAHRWFELGPAQVDTPYGHWTAMRCMPGLIATQRLLGRAQDALELAERAYAAAVEFGGPQLLADVLDQQGFLVAAHDPTAAADRHHLALQVRRDAGLRTFFVDSLEALATAAARAGRHIEAARMIAAADAARVRIGYPRHRLQDGHIQALISNLQSDLGAAGFQHAWKQGLDNSLDDAVAAAARGRGPRMRALTGWDSLTPTERQVAGLVAQGQSNKEIAEHLFVTTATVKTHLVHIYAKVGLSSRVALATLAREHAGPKPPPELDSRSS